MACYDEAKCLKMFQRHLNCMMKYCIQKCAQKKKKGKQGSQNDTANHTEITVLVLHVLECFFKTAYKTTIVCIVLIHALSRA